jgi:hypothetical protein
MWQINLQIAYKQSNRGCRLAPVLKRSNLAFPMITKDIPMINLAELLEKSEDKLMSILHHYTIGTGYSKYSSTLEEAWRFQRCRIF